VVVLIIEDLVLRARTVPACLPSPGWPWQASAFAVSSGRVPMVARVLLRGARLGTGWLAGGAVTVAAPHLPDCGESSLCGVELGGDHVLDGGVQRGVQAEDEFAQGRDERAIFAGELGVSGPWQLGLGGSALPLAAGAVALAGALVPSPLSARHRSGDAPIRLRSAV
jgi:hypothetical protein